jgi:hypothetical protein
MQKNQVRIILVAFAALFITVSSHAQYVWLDEKGTKQFSDMPPPISVPKNRILKTPMRNIEPLAPADASAEKKPDEKLQKPVNTASKNEDFMKRKAEQEEKNKKADAETQAKADKTKNCERARAYQQSLQSGVRISSTDKNGERTFMNDEQRAKEEADVKRALDECK